MKNIFSILIVLLFSICSLNAQILNGGFEQWTSGEPDGWQTNNINEPKLTLTPITQSSFVHGGSSALKGEVLDIPVEGPIPTHAPILVSGTLEDPVFPYSGRPEFIRGYYNYQSVGGDGFVANAFLLAGETPIAVSGFTTYNSTGPGYHELIMHFFYVDTVSIPDAIQILFQITPAPGQIFANAGSTFYIDDFPKMTLIKPNEEGQEFIAGTQTVFIAGEADTIKWDGGGVQNIDIKYSLDDGANYQQIVSNYPADSSRYFWTVPGSLLTRKAKIKVVESQNSSNEIKSINFTIKPWQLTRIDANDELEKFEPNLDGWAFANGGANMWPPSWWQQFSYKPPAIDPNTNVIYPDIEPFSSALQKTFPDWPLFVEVFDTNQCYFSVNNASYNPSAYDWWITVDGGVYQGSCFGFSATSLVAFYFKDLFLAKYPEIGQFSRLNQLTLNNDSRRIINGFYLRQYDLTHLNYERARRNSITAQQTLAELKDMFRLENGDARPLSLYSQLGSGGHSVVPYKLERIGSSTFDLLVYDNQAPGTFQVITIDSSNNNWFDQTTANLGQGTTGCFLQLTSAFYLLGNPIIPPIPESSLAHPVSESLSGIIVLNTPNADIIINSASGNQIGYEDSVEFNNMIDGISIIPLTGGFHPPTGYYIPLDQYSIQLKKFTDSLSYVFFITDSTLYNYRRYSPNNDEIDLLKFAENGIGIKNPDQIEKAISFESTILEDTTSAKIFVTENVLVSAGDSIHYREINRNELLVQNYGDAMNYDLQVRFASVNGHTVFSHISIPMSQNSAHQIIPVWTNLNNEPVTILIDLGNDGTIDDTIFVINQTTNIEDEGSLLSPGTYNLAQNFPNPFNPSTSISYSIPQRSNLTLKVYDIIGNEVANLVNEEKDKGVYTVTFNAGGFSSGIYFYTLRADGFVQTKKMLLIK